MKFFEKNNILVIRLTSMGDVILSSACLRNIRNAFPKSRIDVITSDSLSEIFAYSPYINNLYLYKKNNSKFNNDLKIDIANSLPNKKYDLIIDLQKNRRSKNFSKGLFVNKTTYSKNRLAKLSLVYLKKNITANPLCIPDEYLKPLLNLGGMDDGLGLEIRLPGETDIAYPPFKRKFSRTLRNVAIAPAAKHFTKQWLPEHFAGLCDLLHDKFKCTIHLVGGDDSKEICSYITGHSKAKFVDHSGAASIIQTTEVVDKSDMLITNDSGVMHIGAARRIPIVAIFGSTTTEFGFGPFRTPNIIVETNAPCRPCTHIGREKCPKGHFNCMRMITAENVFTACLRLLESLK